MRTAAFRNIFWLSRTTLSRSLTPSPSNRWVLLYSWRTTLGLSDQAAPMTCAGVTIYNAIRKATETLPVGTVVGITGLGALGHIGVQLARAMVRHSSCKSYLADVLGVCSCRHRCTSRSFGALSLFQTGTTCRDRRDSNIGREGSTAHTRST